MYLFPVGSKSHLNMVLGFILIVMIQYDNQKEMGAHSSVVG
jgi:hypothetical protein